MGIYHCDWAARGAETVCPQLLHFGASHQGVHAEARCAHGEQISCALHVGTLIHCTICWEAAAALAHQRMCGLKQGRLQAGRRRPAGPSGGSHLASAAPLPALGRCAHGWLAPSRPWQPLGSAPITRTRTPSNPRIAGSGRCPPAPASCKKPASWGMAPRPASACESYGAASGKQVESCIVPRCADQIGAKDTCIPTAGLVAVQHACPAAAASLDMPGRHMQQWESVVMS